MVIVLSSDVDVMQRANASMRLDVVMSICESKQRTKSCGCLLDSLLQTHWELLHEFVSSTRLGQFGQFVTVVKFVDLCELCELSMLCKLSGLCMGCAQVVQITRFTRMP